MTRSLNVTPKTTEQHLIVHSDKSVAYLTSNKRLRSTFCTIDANNWQRRSIAQPLCDSTATCWLPWQDLWHDRHRNIRSSVQDRPPSLRKISAKSNQQFQRRCFPTRQTDKDQTSSSPPW